jgi:TolB-like protein
LERKLSAVLAADVVGFSKMMGDAEAETLTALKRHRQELFAPIVNAHGGRIVKLMGDGTLVEFSSVVKAVEAAIAIQEDIAKGNENSIQLRIGINLGDVIVDDDDIYGDGVNIAARIESVAESGGICISANVFEQIDGKIDTGFQDLGERSFKNIDRPIRVYGWTLNKKTAPNSGESLSYVRTSIAVLPFENMSDDPEQEYFADGVAEDIITELSRFGELLVIARNTTFTYKNRTVDIAEVSSKLGVRYMVEGSVRKAGNRVRVTAQLIDGSNGAHIWADRFDRELDDIFAVQDDITAAIVAAVAPGAIEADALRSRGKRHEDLSIWEMVYQARWNASKGSRAGLFEAIDLLERAIDRDPTFSRAYSDLGVYKIYAGIFTWTTAGLDEVIKLASDLAGKALRNDANNSPAQALLGYAYLFNREYQKAELRIAHALDLNPNYAVGHATQMLLFAFTGQFDKAREAYHTVLRLSPYDLLRVRWSAGFAEGAFVAEQYDEGLEIINAAIQENPDYPLPYRTRAAINAVLGHQDQAQRDMGMVRQFMPNMTLRDCQKHPPIQSTSAQLRYVDALRLAGMPE